jgi:hypothetical protein
MGSGVFMLLALGFAIFIFSGIVFAIVKGALRHTKRKP